MEIALWKFCAHGEGAEVAGLVVSATGVYDVAMKRTNVHFDERDLKGLARHAKRMRVSLAHLLRQGAIELLKRLDAENPPVRRGKK